ncbi:MAG: glycosyltransferase family 2 protein [Verrucomicrobiae bacterium]|nr:glycosyltransferase family 2 protein [Verrucomicrobiae bacterium]
MSSTSTLPIGVVIPTYQSMPLLPAHVESMTPWLSQVREIVVVDSYSTDGSLEYLKRCLRHPNVRFFHTPRGAHLSFNYAVAQLHSPYTYFSTVGDSISLDGLNHLYSVATKLDADVVVSPPSFVFDQVTPKSLPVWPPHQICKQFDLREPTVFTGLSLYLIALRFQPDAITGSMASVLYRTSTIRERPLPCNTEYPLAADAAWVISNAFDIRLAITPQVFSTFRFHSKPYPLPADFTPEQAKQTLFDLAVRVLHNEIAEDSSLRQKSVTLRLDELLKHLEELDRSRRELRKLRKEQRPWFFYPSVWRARQNRDAMRAQLNAFLDSVRYVPELQLFKDY